MHTYAIKTEKGFLAVQGNHAWYQTTPDGWAEFTSREGAEAMRDQPHPSGEVVPVTKPEYSIGIDRNGNKVVKVRHAGRRGFSIQTLDNLPETHLTGVGPHTATEVSRWVARYGTARQQAVLSL